MSDMINEVINITLENLDTLGVGDSNNFLFFIIVSFITGVIALTCRFTLNNKEESGKKEWNEYTNFNKIILSLMVGFSSYVSILVLKIYAGLLNHQSDTLLIFNIFWIAVAIIFSIALLEKIKPKKGNIIKGFIYLCWVITFYLFMLVIVIQSIKNVWSKLPIGIIGGLIILYLIDREFKIINGKIKEKKYDEKKFKEFFKNNFNLLVAVILTVVFYFVEARLKLLIGGVILIFLGVTQYLLKLEKDLEAVKHISFYAGWIMIFLGILSLLVFWLLPSRPVWFIVIFPAFLFLAFIFLFVWGKKGWYRILLAIIFFPIFALSIISFFKDFSTLVNTKGICQFFYADLSILFLSIIVVFLMLKGFLKTLRSIWKDNRFLGGLYSWKGIVILFLLLAGYFYFYIKKGVFNVTDLLTILEVFVVIITLSDWIIKKNAKKLVT